VVELLALGRREESSAALDAALDTGAFAVGPGQIILLADLKRRDAFLLLSLNVPALKGFRKFNALYDAALTDLCYGFCAFHRRYLEHLALSATGFEIEAEMVVRAMKGGLRIAEVPSLELPRRAGKSNLHAIRDGIRVLRTVLRGHRGSPFGHPMSVPPNRGLSERPANGSCLPEPC
jgi:hypothetical protein